MNNDELISNGSIKFNELIEIYERKLSNVKTDLKLRTNCKFSYTEGEKGPFIPLRLSNIRELVSVYSFLKEKEKSFSDAMQELNSVVGFITNSEKENATLQFEWLGYSFDDWKNDLFILYLTKYYSSKLEQLKSSKERLESMYSDEKKNSIEINNILSTIDNE